MVDIPGEWEWVPNPNMGYSVCDAYLALTSSTQIEMNTHCDLI
ncbi:hypothetical protein A2U01_0074902, partial [Trifolium medium]|nr:hypothetical protein [Trifolium medium]